jgi:AcrR family transcriptional regulator
MRAALDLVAERGITHVTVDDISGMVDVSSRTFFNYFSSKEEAILGGTPLLRTQIVEQMAAAPAELPMLQALRLALRPAVAEIEQDRELALIRMRICEENPSLLPYLVAAGVELECGLAAAVAARAGVEESDAYPMLVAALVAAMLRVTIMRWAVTGGRRPPLDLLDEAFDALASGLPDPK